jgi:hypothetical protein
VYERRCALLLDTGETVYLEWSQVMRGCCDVVAQIDSPGAFAVLHCQHTPDEFAAKNIAMLRACIPT